MTSKPLATEFTESTEKPLLLLLSVDSVTSVAKRFSDA